LPYSALPSQFPLLHLLLPFRFQLPRPIDVSPLKTFNIELTVIGSGTATINDENTAMTVDVTPISRAIVATVNTVQAIVAIPTAGGIPWRHSEPLR
jgi:hypothetical protein